MPPRSAKSRSSPRIQRDALGVEAVGGLVEDQHLGVAEQRVREPEPLAHAERVLAHALARGRACRARRASSSSSTRRSVDADHLRGDGERLAPAAAAVLGGGVEQDADAAARVRQRAVGARRARRRRRRRAREPARASACVVVLPAPFGPRNPVTVPGSQRNDTSSTTTCAAEALRQVDRFDHGLAGSRRAARATTIRPAVDSAIDFGRGSRDAAVRGVRCGAMTDAAASSTPGCCRRCSSRRAGGTTRSARDWIVDVMMYLVALAIGVAFARRGGPPGRALGRVSSLLDVARSASSALSRCGAAPVPGRGRVAALTLAGGGLSASPRGRGADRLFNVAVRAAAPDVAIVGAISLASVVALPDLLPGPATTPLLVSFAIAACITIVVRRGACSCARARELVALAARAGRARSRPSSSVHVEQAREAERRADRARDARRARAPALAAHACTRARSSSGRTRRRRRSREAAGVIRATAHAGAAGPARGDRRAARGAGGGAGAAAADARRHPRAGRGVARGRDARARRRESRTPRPCRDALGRTAYRDRAGGADERAQARARRGGRGRPWPEPADAARGRGRQPALGGVAGRAAAARRGQRADRPRRAGRARRRRRSSTGRTPGGDFVLRATLPWPA